MAQVLLPRFICLNCQRLRHERVEMELLSNGQEFCRICKTVMPSRSERGKSGIASIWNIILLAAINGLMLTGHFGWLVYGIATLVEASWLGWALRSLRVKVDA